MSDTNIQSDTPAHLDPRVTPDAAAHDPRRAVAEWSEAEWKEFHKSDIGAGGAVVVLMTAIFSIGLILYTVIAFVVAR